MPGAAHLRRMLPLLVAAAQAQPVDTEREALQIAAMEALISAPEERALPLARKVLEAPAVGTADAAAQRERQELLGQRADEELRAFEQGLFETGGGAFRIVRAR